MRETDLPRVQPGIFSHIVVFLGSYFGSEFWYPAVVGF
jgi:hypothetical protein